MKTVKFEGVEYTVPEWVGYVARDMDGFISGYYARPMLGDEEWIDGEDWIGIQGENTLIHGSTHDEGVVNGVNWADSLVEI